MAIACSDPTDPVRAHLDQAGVHARPLRRVLALMSAGPQPLEQLIRVPALPRRTVEELIAVAGDDVARTPEGYSLAPEVRDAYRRRFALDDLEPQATDAAVLECIRDYVTSGPQAQAALDHVAATPETVLRRAEWFRDSYELAHAHVLCLGDHDLTSLALALVAPSAQVTVVDVDEQVLAHIDDVAEHQGLQVRTVHTDLRFGLPPSVQQRADLVFTDPPYTPEGIALFASRAVEALANSSGRVAIAYGFSDRSPALGLKVQQELLRLGLVFEAIYPAFHRYDGAQAIGSASDLYVCQPTARARKARPRQDTGIYTHGPQSVEAQPAERSESLLRAVSERVGTAVSDVRAPTWDKPIRSQAIVAVDLRADPGPWLLRTLLACNTDVAAFIVGNHHPDITSELAQRALAELVAGKYLLRFYRSTPDPRTAVVVATSAADSPLRGLLRHAHGKLGNVWRDALIEAHGLSQREARQRVRELAPYPGDLDLRLVDVPRHRLRALLRGGLGLPSVTARELPVTTATPEKARQGL